MVGLSTVLSFNRTAGAFAFLPPPPPPGKIILIE